MTAKILLAFLVLKVFYFDEITAFKFELTKTIGWQYPGRCLNFTLKATLTESTPLSLKVLAPHVNAVPHMIILGSELSKDGGCQSFTGSDIPVITARTSNKALKDDLKIDLRNVTVVGTCVMHFDIKFQLISHANFANGQVIWPGFAVQYQNDTVYAAQHAVKTMTTASSPSLKVSLEPAEYVFDSSNPMVVTVKVTHDCLRTTAKAVTAEVTVVPPPAFQYSKFSVKSGSVAVTKKAGSDLVFQAGEIDFYQEMNFDLEFTMDTASVKRGRDLETATFFADVKATGSASCAIQEEDYPSTDSLTTSAAVYKKFSTCDAAPGSGADDIVYQSFSASSYSASSPPDKAKFGISGSWRPSDSPNNKNYKDRRQFLQVSFTTLVKLRRFSIKGQCERYVKTLKLFHSTNGAIWKPIMEGSNVKIFQANKDCKSTAIVPLPYDIEAKSVRINPVDFNSAIAVKIEFYGCKSTTVVIDPPIEIPNRSIIGHLDNVIVCNIGMYRKAVESSCHFSSDGQLWKALYFRVLHVAFFDPVSRKLYGLGGFHGNIPFRSTLNIEEAWEVVSLNEFTTKKATSGIVMAKSADSVVLNNDQSSLSPLAANVLPANTASITWGFSGKGVHLSTDGGTNWSLRVIWSCKDVKEM